MPQQEQITEQDLGQLLGALSGDDKLYEIAEKLITENKDLKERAREEKYETFCPFDNKYKPEDLIKYLTYAAEWKYCGKVLEALVRGMHHFGLAKQKNVDEMARAVELLSPANCVELEGELRHDMRALKAEIRKHVSEETAMIMYPGTTSYDILDTARAWAYKDAMNEVVIPAMEKLLGIVLDRAEEYLERPQIGRTHGQSTSPVLFGYVLASFADRLADRIENMQLSVKSLEGKIAGIVGTNASTQIVLGDKAEALEFEKYVLEKVIGINVCGASSQIVPKDKLGDMVHYMNSFDGILADMSNSFRHLQRSEINEITEKKKGQEGGGSSADPSKTNPINSENVNGMWESIINSMQLLYHMQVSDHQRDLRGSVQARFEPTHTICGVYESTKRMTRIMENLAVYDEMMDRNIKDAITANSEYMNAVLIHHRIDGYDMVKRFSIDAKRQGRPLLDIALEDLFFKKMWDETFSPEQKEILSDMKGYTGKAYEKANKIIDDVRCKFSLYGD